MADTEDRISEITRERSAEIDSQIAWFTGSLEKLLAKWRSEIEELLDNLPSAYGASRLAELDYLKNQLAHQLAKMGYDDLAKQFVALYDDAEKSVLAQIHALGIEPRRLAPLDQDVLRTLKEIDLGRYFRASQTTIGVLSEGIVLNTIDGLPKAEIFKNVERSLDDFKHLTTTYVQTGISIYDRSVVWRTLSGVVDKWRYDGPVDQKTRPFCAEHHGKVYTAAQLDSLDNGAHQPKPIHIWLGGWNCRHHLTAMV